MQKGFTQRKIKFKKENTSYLLEDEKKACVCTYDPSTWKAEEGGSWIQPASTKKQK